MIFQGPSQSLPFCDSEILSFHRLQISLVLHAEAKHQEHGLFQSTKNTYRLRAGDDWRKNCFYNWSGILKLKLMQACVTASRKEKKIKKKIELWIP